MVKSVEVSIIVPIYNEEKRMLKFIKQLLDFSNKNLKSYEILFVDDGSSDKSIKILEKLINNNKNCKIIAHKKNKGKGAAIQTGVKNAIGKKIIFIDADGSIAPDELPNMIKKLEKYDVVSGSRALKKSKVKQNGMRRLTSNLFNPYVNFLFGNNVPDHLCGFKGFKRQIAIDLFSNLYDKRWLFDVEVFYLMRKKNYTFCEIPLNWEHKVNSKMSIFEPIKMGFKLIKLKFLLSKYN